MSLLRQFLLVDLLAFIVVGGVFVYLGFPEGIVGLLAGYVLGLQTGTAI